jgi:hypothetical protein
VRENERGGLLLAPLFAVFQVIRQMLLAHPKTCPCQTKKFQPARIQQGIHERRTAIKPFLHFGDFQQIIHSAPKRGNSCPEFTPMLPYPNQPVGDMVSDVFGSLFAGTATGIA